MPTDDKISQLPTGTIDAMTAIIPMTVHMSSGTPTTIQASLQAFQQAVQSDASYYSFSASISSNNLTVRITHSDGTDPSISHPLNIRINSGWISLTSALSVTITAAAGDVFGWDGGKIQGNDAQLFVYLINNNGTPQLGVSPCPTLTTIATNYRDAGGQTGSAGHTNIVMSGTRNATNTCGVIGRVNVNQADSNNWQNPVTSNIVTRPIYETDWINWTPIFTGFSGTPSGTYTIYQVRGDTKSISALLAGGTSNDVVFTMTLPILPTLSQSFIIPFVTDNGTIQTTPGRLAVGVAVQAATARKDTATGAWTNTGTKNINVTANYL